MGRESRERNYSIIESTNWYSYVANNPVKYVDPTGMENKVAIVGNDDAWGVRKSFYEAAVGSGNRILSPGIPVTIPIIGGYGATNSGRQAINLLRRAGRRNQITDIFFSTHGSPYAIDFDNPGNNLYTSAADVSNVSEGFSAGKNAAFISDIQGLVADGIIADDVTITLAGCLLGANPENVPGDANSSAKAWAANNQGSSNPANFAQLLSEALPNATIIANRDQVDSGVGMESPVMYKNGQVVTE